MRKLARPNIFQVEDRIEVYDLVQQTLLAIPGHAKYFQQEIEREQEAVKNYPTSTGPRCTYDFNRAIYFQTLAHLPSSETVSVLGHFLSDDKDTPRPLISPGSDWGENPRANSFASACTLTEVGLRDAPGTWKEYDANPDAQLAKARAWWEEIQSGRKTFSFRGQNVEYRFKPDGTWETLALVNAPDDGPKAAETTDAKRPDLKNNKVTQTPARKRVWWWWVVPALLALAAIVWKSSRKQSR